MSESPRQPQEQVEQLTAKRVGPAPRIVLPNTVEGFITFYNFMFTESGFRFAPHLHTPARALLDPRIMKLLVIIGPGSGKSLMMSVAFPAFALGQDPSLTVLGISAGEALIQGFMSAIQSWIEHSPFWKILFPEVTPNKDIGWSTERGLFVTGHNAGDPDASYFGCGLTSKALTGKHARLINGDDLHDKENSGSADSCLRVRDSYYRQILGRADPRGARYVFAGRRWHEEDVYGHFKQTGEWVVLELPAVREKQRRLYWDLTIPDDLVCTFNDPVEDERRRKLIETMDSAERAAHESTQPTIRLVDPLGRPI